MAMQTRASSRKLRSETCVGDRGIDALPDEMLLHIFQHLPLRAIGRSAQVCRRWKSLCYNQRLYESVKLTQRRYKRGTLGFILERGIKRLSCTGVAFRKKYFLKEMAPGTSYRLEELVSLGCRLEENGIISLLSRCRQLTKVFLSMRGGNEDMIDALALNKNLTVLRICTAGLSLDSVLTLARSCRRLRIFKWVAASCCGSTNRFSAEELYQIAAELPQTIEETDSFCPNQNISDDHVASIVDHLPNLRVVELCSSKLTEKSIEYCFALRNLEALNISCCDAVTNKVFRPLIKMQSVKSMKLFCASRYKDDVKALRNMLPKIRIVVYER